MRQGRQVRRCLLSVWARAWPAAILLASAAPLLIAGAAWAQEPEAPVPAPLPPPVIGTAMLPRDLSPWGMFSTPTSWCRRS